MNIKRALEEIKKISSFKHNNNFYGIYPSDLYEVIKALAEPVEDNCTHDFSDIIVRTGYCKKCGAQAGNYCIKCHAGLPNCFCKPVEAEKECNYESTEWVDGFKKGFSLKDKLTKKREIGDNQDPIQEVYKKYIQKWIIGKPISDTDMKNMFQDFLIAIKQHCEQH